MNFLIAGSEAKGLLADATIEDSFAHDRDSHEGVCLRRYAIGNQSTKELQRVTHRPRLCIVNLEMQVRPCRVACIAADGDEVASLDGELTRRKKKREGVLGTSALQLLLVKVGKALQVAVDTGVAVRMTDVDGISKAIHVNCQPTDVTIGDRKDILALNIAGFDVDTPMEVPRTRLTEVTRQHDVIVDGRDIF